MGTACFPMLFRVLPNYHKCFHNCVETQGEMFSIGTSRHCHKRETAFNVGQLLILHVKSMFGKYGRGIAALHVFVA